MYSVRTSQKQTADGLGRPWAHGSQTWWKVEAGEGMEYLEVSMYAVWCAPTPRQECACRTKVQVMMMIKWSNEGRLGVPDIHQRCRLLRRPLDGSIPPACRCKTMMAWHWTGAGRQATGQRLRRFSDALTGLMQATSRELKPVRSGLASELLHTRNRSSSD